MRSVCCVRVEVPLAARRTMLTFKTKYIEYAGEGRRRIVCQNLNGPCPLLALCNALILRGSLTLPARTEVTSRELQDALIGFVLDKRSSREDANGAHQLEDTIALVHQGRFVEGLDVNPGFGSATSLEFTPELAVFDLCGVQLVHGWVADAQDKDTFELLRGLSYNQVTLAVAAGLEDGIVDQLRSLSGSLHRQLTRRYAPATPEHSSPSLRSLRAVNQPPFLQLHRRSERARAHVVSRAAPCATIPRRLAGHSPQRLRRTANRTARARQR